MIYFRTLSDPRIEAEGTFRGRCQKIRSGYKPDYSIFVAYCEKEDCKCGLRLSAHPTARVRLQMIWIDNARIIATFAVVLLHVASGVINPTADLTSLIWWAANLYDSSVRWCVPVFVMISGLLLLDPSKKESILIFYKKRGSKILIPLIFWTIFYLIWDSAISIVKGEGFSPKTLLENVISGKPYHHMWYLYMVLTLYAFTPFLRKLVGVISSKETMFLSLLMFVMASITWIFHQFSPASNQPFFNQFLLYLPYYFSGYLIGKCKSSLPQRVLMLIFILGILSTASGCYLLGKTFGTNRGLYFYGYLSVTVIPTSLSFCLLLRGYERPLFRHSVIRKLASISLGMYLIHPVFIIVFIFIGIRPKSFNPIISIPMIALAIIFLSSMTALLFQKIPYLRRVI